MSTNILQIDGGTFVAPEELTIQTVEQLKDDLLVAIGSAEKVVTIALDHVVHIDTAAAQLLLAARKTMAGSGRELKLDQPSDDCRNIVDQLGLTDALFGAS